jgi:O-glycosyl hydrolase
MKMTSNKKDVKMRSIVPLSVIVAILMFFCPFWETKIMTWYAEKSYDHDMTLTFDLDELGDEFDGFGCSSCWWSQIAGNGENAEEIAKLLYSEEGLGLNIYRYNVGAGSADNFKDTIGDPWRRSESFYVYDYETETGYYDFSRDANAQAFLDLCLSYGCIDTVVLFANSPHYSLTRNNKTGGNDNWWVCNLPEENYEAYADYFLTITEYFIEKGVPVKYISPINEPNWSWGNSGYAGQEGCFYGSEEIYGVYRAFAKEMAERNIEGVLLSGPESGEISHRTYEWFEYMYNDPEIRPYLGNLSYHSYWTDNNVQNKIGLGNWIEENITDLPVEMSEWCELPCESSIDSIKGALIQARVMANDINFTNVDSWTAWVGVNGIGIGADGKEYSDGLLVATDGNISDIKIPMRYYAVAHFSKFIPVGSRTVAVEKDIYDYIEERDAEGNIVEANYITNPVAFLTPEGKVVLVMSNEGVNRKVKFKVDRDNMTVYTTTQEMQLQETYSGKTKEITIPENSITTIVFE